MRTHQLARRIVAVATVLAAGAAVPAGSAVAAADGARNPYPISWQPCPGQPAAQCGTVRVPLDWARPKGERITLALARHPATDPARRIGALFINPGGPGGSGVEVAAAADIVFSADLLARFDIVGVDPRGVAGSTPVRCVVPPAPPGFTLFPRTEAQFQQMVRTNRELGLSCLRDTGPLLGHVDTVSVARDHEAVRIGLGEAKFNWIGLSYGTQIGINYAQLYPHRVRAMVFDSALEHSLGNVPMLADEMVTAEDAFNRFAQWCRTTPTCALAGQDVAARYDEIVARADRDPIPVPWAAHPVTGEDIRLNTQGYLLFKEPNVFRPVSQWLVLADGIKNALAGDASAFATPPLGPTDATYAALSVGCMDYPSEIRTFAEMQMRIQLGRQLAPHLQGATETWRLAMCTGWPLPPANPPRRLDVRGVPPVLIVNATHDASTAYQWAHGIAAQVRGSVVLTRIGDGHLSYPVSACARAAIDRYLIERITPDPTQTCAD